MQEITVEKSAPIPPTIEFCKRLLKFYHSQPDTGGQLSELWDMLSRGFLLPLINALNSFDASKVSDVLSNLYSNKVMFGLDSSAQYLEALDIELGQPEHVTQQFYKDASLGLLQTVATNFGGVAAWNCEQEAVRPIDPEAALDTIETAIGCKLTHPGGGAISGLRIGERFVPHKLIDAACIVASLQRLELHTHSSILEIGAGASWLGYLLNWMGFADCYHTIDLPVVSVIGAYMLACGCGEKAVWLHGEDSPGSLMIHGIHDLEGWRLTRQSLVINQNSFPEMPHSVQDHFLSILEDCIVTDGIFFSINHESSNGGQRRVYDVFSKSKAFRLRHRSPCWARPGWIEEVWEHV